MSAKRICIEKDQQTSDDCDKDRKKVVINSLDYDSLAIIIMLLPIPERIDMEKVCTKWKEACQLAWYDIKEYNCETSIGRCQSTQSYLEKILLRCGIYLKKLSLSDICNSSIMPFVGDHCKNLTTLECKFDDKSLIDNADHFVQAFTQLNNLKCIKITVDHSNEIINLSAIINSLPEEINEIHLFSKFLRNQKQNIFMSFQRFRNLKKLTISVGLCLDDNIILEEIANITTLVYLSIRLYDINKKSSLFNKLVNLEYIYLTIDNYYIPKEIIETIFCTCKNLKHLDIPPGSYDAAKTLHKKWINFKNLEYLGFFCDITLDVTNSIVEYCKNLKHIRIWHYCIVNDTALKKLTELENLESLMFEGPYKLHEESITTISNNCKKLKRLNIPKCPITSIKGEPLSSPSVLDELSKLQCLEHLNFCCAENVNDSTITAIANNCKNLKSLNIDRCRGLTKRALIALTNLKNLEKLNVSYLFIITDSFLIKLKGLKELQCDGCRSLTYSGIIQFIKNNPDLEKISVCRISNIVVYWVIEAADQATKNRTNGIILNLKINNPFLTHHFKFKIKSQWLVVDGYYQE